MAAKLILAFDTTTDYLSMALGNQDNLKAQRFFLNRRAHLSGLVPAIKEMLATAAVSLKSLSALAVGVGPGSFTGTRIGVATAKGLAQGSGKPLYGLVSLDILAAAVGGEVFYPLVDAGRGEVYTARYQCQQRDGDIRLLSLPAATALLEAETGAVNVAGNALLKYEARLREKLGDKLIIAPRRRWYPDAELMAAVAAQAPPPAADAYFEIKPVYLRLSDAEERLRRSRNC